MASPHSPPKPRVLASPAPASLTNAPYSSAPSVPKTDLEREEERCLWIKKVIEEELLSGNFSKSREERTFRRKYPRTIQTMISNMPIRAPSPITRGRFYYGFLMFASKREELLCFPPQPVPYKVPDPSFKAYFSDN